MSQNRINLQITEKTVYLIGSTGEKIGETNISDALKMAQEEGLDLVEVSRNPKSICKIMDWKKELYIRSKKEKMAKKATMLQHHTQKEIRFSTAIEKHDLETKVNQIKKLADSGHKVVVTIQMKGRQIQRPHIASELMNSIINLIGNGYKNTGIKNAGKDVSTTVEIDNQ